MASDDLNLAFVRHATSKIRKTDDLYTLNTKGFSEALASIAAISNVEAYTRTSKDEVSHYLKIEAVELPNNGYLLNQRERLF